MAMPTHRCYSDHNGRQEIIGSDGLSANYMFHVDVVIRLLSVVCYGKYWLKVSVRLVFDSSCIG